MRKQLNKSLLICILLCVQDAMGRWYCCNDSFVSVSTLQEVLSEKVYILFFSRTNQRPASASTALASNGIRSRDCNGSETFKSPKAALPTKSVHPKASFDQSFQKEVSTIPKGVKVPSSPRMRFNLSNSNSKRPLANGNGKLDAHKILSMEANGDVKASNSTEKSEKNVANMNGFNKTENVDVADSKNSKAFTLTVENGISQRADINLVKPDGGEVNGTMSRVTVGGPDHHELGTCAVNGHAEISGSQRKSKDEGSCILLAQDSQFQEKIEELKEVYVMPFLFLCKLLIANNFCSSESGQELLC